jgi:tetratricopeptide (TPR) repeat protein
VFKKLFLHKTKETIRYLSSTEAATLAGVSPETIRRLCKDGIILDAIQRKKGGPWYIPETSIISWLGNPSYLPIALKRGKRKRSFFDYFGKLIAAIVTIVAILALISIVADFTTARQQLANWGIYIPIQEERNGEILVIVTNFEYSEGVANSKAHQEIYNAIKNAAKSINLNPNEFRIELLPQIISADDIQSAQKLAEKYNAHIVIWGGVTDVRVTANFFNNKGYSAWTAPLSGYYIVRSDTKKIPTSAQTITITDTANSLTGNPAGYAQLITSNLPEQLSFLSFLVIGQSFYPSDFHRCAEYIEHGFSYSISDKSATGLIDEAYYWQGVCYIEGGDTKKGIISLKKSIEINPQNVFAHLRLCQSSWDLDQYNDAVKNFSYLIDLIENPKEGDNYKLLLWIAYQGRGLVRLEQVAQEDGQSYREDQKFEDIKLQDSTYSFLEYAKTYYSKHQTELLASVSDLENAQRSYQNDFLSTGALGVKEKIQTLDLMADQYGALMKLGKFQDALNVVFQMDKVTEIPLNNYYKALAYEALGELPKALEKYELYISLEPDYKERFIPGTVTYLKEKIGVP